MSKDLPQSSATTDSRSRTKIIQLPVGMIGLDCLGVFFFSTHQTSASQTSYLHLCLDGGELNQLQHNILAKHFRWLTAQMESCNRSQSQSFVSKYWQEGSSSFHLQNEISINQTSKQVLNRVCSLAWKFHSKQLFERK